VDAPAGFVGLILANNFMKREFGARLISEVLPSLDLTHVVDCSGIAVPAHGTPTAILFGRNQAPVSSVVRTVRGIRGDPAALDDPAKGSVWLSIVTLIDRVGSSNEFIDAEDTPRKVLAEHPWNMGGGGTADLQHSIEGAASETLEAVVASIGFYQDTHADEAFVQPISFFRRHDMLDYARPQVRGNDCRDWMLSTDEGILFPYDRDLSQWESVPAGENFGWFWSLRTILWNRTTFGGGTYREAGRPWFDYHQFPIARAHTPNVITFAFVQTHNHFVYDRGGKVFNRSAPVIRLPPGVNEDKHLGLVGLLNSSTACFWIRQVCHNKGGQGVNEGTKAEAWERFLEITGTRIGPFPITSELPLDLARKLEAEAQVFAANRPVAISAVRVPTRKALDVARDLAETARGNMIALQEELDWRCYLLYGLIDASVESPAPPRLRLGERAFEILLARQIAAGTAETAWFTRHGSTPITDLPSQWPDDYRTLVERRIALIEANPSIGLLEKPEFKRRWSMDPWEKQEQDALRVWLLDRLDKSSLWITGDPRLLSTNQLADLMLRDSDFLSVAELYSGRPDLALEVLLAELIAQESVPFLAKLRYTDTGLRKRLQWEETWARQRREDAIDAEVARRHDEFHGQAQRRVHERWRDINPRRPGEEAEPYAVRMEAEATGPVKREVERLIAEEQRGRKREEVGDIPVPPKYVPKDLQSSDYWRLRGSLDVPKERFVSFPHCQRDADGSLVVTWSGHNHLKRALAIAAYYQERKENEGWPPERLVPLLAGVIELLPWLLQWHNGYDADLGARMGDYFLDFVQTEARALGMTKAAVAAWMPPANPRRRRSRRVAA